MLIWLKQPSYVFHGHDVSPKFYSMWKTVTGKHGTTANEVASSIYNANIVAMASNLGPLQNVVINVHGSPGLLRLGGIGGGVTMTEEITPFSVLYGIGTIWLVSCDVARDYAGKKLCSTLARLTGSVVVAAEQSQVVTAMQAFQLFISRGGGIDAFEGQMIAFYPNGSTRSGNDPEKLVSTLRDPIKPESEYPEEAWLRGAL